MTNQKITKYLKNPGKPYLNLTEDELGYYMLGVKKMTPEEIQKVFGWSSMGLRKQRCF